MSMQHQPINVFGLERFFRLAPVYVFALLLLIMTGFAKADPMSMPAMSGPLAANANPLALDLQDPLGKIYVTGALTGLGLYQNNASPGNKEWIADLSNGQVFVQKIDGPVQFFVQAGEYAFPSLGAGYLRSNDTVSATYGAVPQAFLKLVPSSNFSVLIGKLPTLIGDEYTFSFENMNILRGLLWNQEPAVSRGVQGNYTSGPLTISLSWNDGFYSNHYNWVSGLASYAFNGGSDTLAFVGGGNLGRSGTSSSATPFVQNNGEIFNLIWTHTQGPWVISPYLQYTHVPADSLLGIARGASTIGGALLVSYKLNEDWKLAGRAEYISSSGNGALGAPNLLYGAGSDAWSITLTPTYQHKQFFVRAEFTYVAASGETPGLALGPTGTDTNQSRVLLETGILF
ncbi:MAG TPA: outer membrane beta-barrel protein [Alphaproteobacteria bacterium]|nr:outer membrane beta-barrel protein [Alphaproteobacteria bacterium]